MGKILLDGMTRTETMKTLTGIDIVTFTYRPALPDRVAHYHTLPKPDGKATAKAIYNIVLEHLQSWDIDHLTEKGQTAPLNEESLAKLPYLVLTYILDTICSYGSSEKLVQSEKNSATGSS